MMMKYAIVSTNLELRIVKAAVCNDALRGGERVPSGTKYVNYGFVLHRGEVRE